MPSLPFPSRRRYVYGGFVEGRRMANGSRVANGLANMMARTGRRTRSTRKSNRKPVRMERKKERAAHSERGRGDDGRRDM
ncbi:hypothetical protein MPTK1_1g23350 [Marchantia polymorpha subsp. ruderalis]|uniref:Uncharacterized protein n=2 Tax=Marchantia polymorpha TaxID=3197 RepID=A0AAF6ATF6_MARPO|nr:hypothetical protein MARPO_0065s0043 [Marchantia polymorpha]BBM99726.1 hypothetical protein Mp_1g23350 [Marchantia polymorpha subsp. ruderalis]|eukprot:PTQ36230.1 hypothetical protein MARPO_0065s0043 [Marchantia polymorpha]